MAENDTADLRLRVDTRDVGTANQSLDEFKRHATGAASSTRDFGQETDRLARSMQQMLAMQRETNQLLQQNINVTRQGTQAVDDHIGRLTQLTTTLNGATLAYEVFGRRGTEMHANLTAGVQGQIAAYQSLIGTLDQLSAKMAQLQQISNASWTSNLRNTFAPVQAPGYGSYSLGGFGPISTGENGQLFLGSVMGTLLPTIQNSLSQQTQQILQAFQAQAARGAISTSQLGLGMATGQQMGVGGAVGADMVIKMQHALDDLGQAAEFQRLTLHEYGITTKDANQALREFVTQLSRVRDSQEKTLTAQQFGLDPALLTRETAARLNPPPGSQADIEQKQRELDARIAAQTADLQDQVKALQLTQTRTFYGLLPYTANIAQFGSTYSTSNYDWTQRNLRLQEERLSTEAARGDVGFWETQRREYSLLGKGLQTGFGRIFGTAPATTEGANDTRPPALIPPQLTQELEEFNRSIGRLTPQGIQAQITQEQRRGQDIVNKFADFPEAQAKAQKDLNEAMAFLAEKLRRAADPVAVFTQQLDMQNQAAGQAPNVAQITRAEAQLSMEQMVRTGNGNLTSEQRASISSAFQGAFTGHGEEAMRTTRDEIEQQKLLAHAYADGGREIADLTAKYQAALEVQKGVGTAAGEANRIFQLLTLSLAEMNTEAEKNILRAQEEAQGAGRVAAAGGNPVAQRQAELFNQAMGPSGVNYNPRYQALLAAGQYSGIADLNRQLDEEVKALQAQQASKAAATRATGAFQAGQSTGALTGAIMGTGQSGGFAAPVETPNFSIRPGVRTDAGTETDIADILSRAAKSLPPGYRLEMTSGYRPGGSQSPVGMHSQHVLGNAGDFHIVGPGGPIPATGADTTGLYGQLAQNARAVQQQLYPQFNNYWRWGGAFGANGGPIGPGSPADLEHFDVRGYQGGALPVSATVNDPVAIARARAVAEQQLQSQGAPYTSADVARVQNEKLRQQTVDQAAALEQETAAQKALLPLEQARIQATLQGGDALRVLDDQIKIATDMQKLFATATSDQLPILDKLKGDLTTMSTAVRQNNEEVARAQIEKTFTLQQEASGRAISAFQTGGLSAMNLQEASEANRQALVNTGMDPQTAQELASQMAVIAQKAQDTKTALTDAANEISTTMKAGVGDIVDGLTKGIGQAHGFRYAMEDAGLAISKLGLDMFVKKPLQTLTDNIASGRGFNFNVGTSGISTSEALGTAFASGIGKTLGLGPTAGYGNSASPHASNTSGLGEIGAGGAAAGEVAKDYGDQGSNWLADMFGGKNSFLGRKAIDLLGTRGDNTDTSNGSDTGDYGGGGDTGSTDSGDGSNLGANLKPYHIGGRIYHEGSGGIDTLLPDEVPAILQTGEMVLSRKQTGAFDKLFPGGTDHMLKMADAYPSVPGQSSYYLFGRGNFPAMTTNRSENSYDLPVSPQDWHDLSSGLWGANDNPRLGLAPGQYHKGGLVLPRFHDGGFLGSLFGDFQNGVNMITGGNWGVQPPNPFATQDTNMQTAAPAMSGAWNAIGVGGMGGKDNWSPSELNVIHNLENGIGVDFKGRNEEYAPEIHTGGLIVLGGVKRFHDGGSVSDTLDEMLSQSDKQPAIDWSGGPSLGGGTHSGVSPMVNKSDQSPGNAFFAQLALKAEGGLKSFLGGVGGGGGNGGDGGGYSGGDASSVSGDYGGGGDLGGADSGGFGADYAGSSIIAHRGGRIGYDQFPRFHDGGFLDSLNPLNWFGGFLGNLFGGNSRPYSEQTDNWFNSYMWGNQKTGAGGLEGQLASGQIKPQDAIEALVRLANGGGDPMLMRPGQQGDPQYAEDALNQAAAIRDEYLMNGTPTDYSGGVIAHGGGRIGYDQFPRFHDGVTLAADEVPAILQKGETVSPAYSPPPAVATGAGQSSPVVIHQNIYTPDANSFRASADQVAAAAHAAHARSMRNT